MKKETISLKRNFAFSTLYQIFTMITPLITAPYISRVLGVEKVGIYSYVGSIQSYFLLFAALGTAVYGNREIAQARDQKEIYSKKFYEIELLTIITSAVCLILWLALIIFDEKYRLYYIAMIPFILGAMFDISWFYNGLENFKVTVISNFVFKIIGIVCIFLFVNTKNDLMTYIFIMAMTTMLSNLSMWIYLPQYICTVDIKKLKLCEHFKQTIMYFIPTIATSIYTVFDKTLIGIITENDYQNGYYEQATKIINIAKSVSFTAVNAVLSSRMSYLFAKNKEEEVKSRIANSMNFIMFMTIGCCFGIAGVAEKFVPLFFGEGYEEVITLLYIFAPIIVIIGVSNCLGTQYYAPSGRKNDGTKYLLVGSVINLLFNLLLIPRAGAEGAAIASVIAETCISFLYLKNCYGFVTLKQLQRYVYKKIIAGTIMFIVVFFLGRIMDRTSILVLALQVILGVFVYVICLLCMKDKWMLNTLNSVWSRVKRERC